MKTSKKYDACIIGSGAGAGPIILKLSQAGLKVVVLEKGPWIKSEEFTKDEMVSCRKDSYSPKLKDEFHTVEKRNKSGDWIERSTAETNSSYWNGTCVGGSSNFMSAFFHRLKPNDFKLRSTYGPIKNANIVDWPISYEDLEPYYSVVESEVGISGRIVNHSTQEPRSTPTFPFPALNENIVAGWLDNAAEKKGYQLVPIARGILSKPKKDRKPCYYSGYCGSFGCSSNAKGSSRAALLNQAIETGNCTIIPNAKVFHLETDGNKNVRKAHYYFDKSKRSISADLFVVACNAIETTRMLLLSKNSDTPNGLGNEFEQVGKNMISTCGGGGSGSLNFSDFNENQLMQLRQHGSEINRSLQHWYEIDDPQFNQKMKGGTVDFVFDHNNPIPKVFGLKRKNGLLNYGSELKNDIKQYFTNQKTIGFEIFCDWLPTDDGFISLSKTHVDKWGDPVAKIRLNKNHQVIEVSEFIAKKSAKLLEEIGVKNVTHYRSTGPSRNLVAGGCRFGNNPETSVLDKNCKVHSISNLYVTDGSFMPTGGSVPFTWTIYANSFRIADIILKRLKKRKGD